MNPNFRVVFLEIRNQRCDFEYVVHSKTFEADRQSEMIVEKMVLKFKVVVSECFDELQYFLSMITIFRNIPDHHN